MDVQKKLDDIAAAVSGARSVPMSASCVVNRAELLALLDEVRQALPGSLAQAQELLTDREQMVEQARAEAERIIESAQAQGGSLVSDTEVARRSQAEADRILSEARREAEEIRAQADDYVDSKLANFEVVLTKTIGSVDRGREKLLGRDPGAAGHLPEDAEDAEAPERSADPETLRRRADAYVDAKFGAFEAVLAKTLEAVGRGRMKLQGARAIDELGAHLAAQGDAAVHTGDADYLADLAALRDPEGTEGPASPGRPPLAAPEPVAQDYGYQPEPSYQADPGYQAEPAYQADPAYQQHHDPYGYQQQPVYPGQPQQHEGYGYQEWQQQADPYGAPAPDHGMGQEPGLPPQPGYHPDVYVPQQQGGALDETSLFDTSMIDLEQLRRYEDGQYRTG
ncbi:cell division initiation protein [Streptomyces sp. NPDC059740]|uniref:ATP synthase F0 subunit B n=1 Tax=Streptomyces sp. NPDC059740 TaxID=3346926 RepID=UPI0036645296